jgi:hypothetical protein
MAVEQVGQAVEIVGDEDGDVAGRSGEGEAPVHLELLGERGEGGAEVRFIAMGVVGGELDTHEEEAELDVLMLVGIEDVRVALLHEKVGDGGDETFTVGAVDEKNGGLGHGVALIRAFFRWMGSDKSRQMQWENRQRSCEVQAGSTVARTSHGGERQAIR